MAKKQTGNISEKQKQEYLVFISCIQPRSINQIAKVWGYSESSLYGKFNRLLDNKSIALHHKKKRRNFVEKFYLTNFDAFFSHLEEGAFSIFKEHSEELEKFYGRHKEMLSLELIADIFNCPNYLLNEFGRKLPEEHGIRNFTRRLHLVEKEKQKVHRYIAYHYFDIVMPVALYFSPICIKMIQSRKTGFVKEKYPLNIIMTTVNLISPRFAKYPSGSWRTKSYVTSQIIKIALYNYAEKFMQIDIPDDFVKALYKSAKGAIKGYGSADSELTLMTEEERKVILERLESKKYDVLED